MKRIARWARQFGMARAVCMLLLFALVPLRIADPLPLEELRLRTFDLFQVLRPREQTVRPVVIVDIDEASLKEIGQWPWPRTVIADLDHPAARCRRRRDRLRHHLRRARPHVAGRSRRQLPRSRRGDARKACRTAQQRRGLRRSDQESGRHRRRRGRRGQAAPRAEGENAPQTGFAIRRARSAAVSGHVSRSAAQHPADRAGRRRARAVLDRSGTRRHRPPRAGRHGGAGRNWCRR